jgi:hypothetical protein
MKVTLQNLTQDRISTDLGLLEPMSSLELSGMTPDQCQRMAFNMKTFVDNDVLTVTVAQDADALDSLEPATVSTASVADGAVSTVKLAAGCLSADAAGRAKMAAALFNEATVDAKFVDGAVNGGKLKAATIVAGKYGAASIATADLAANAVTHAKLDTEIGAKSADVTITTGQLLALNATPKTLVAAPGAGYALVFEGAVLYMAYNSVAYNGVAAGEDFAFKYTGTSGSTVATVESTGFIDQATNQLRYARPAGAAINDCTPVDNAALVLHLLSGEIATGNSPLKVRVYYRVIPSSL